MNESMRSLLDAMRKAADQRSAEPGYQEAIEREQKRRDVALVALKDREWRDRVASCVPLRVARHVWEPRETIAASIALKWATGERSHDLVLRGGVGTGKSTAVALAIKALCEPDVRWSDCGAIPTDPFRGLVTWLRPDALVSAIMHAYDDKAPKLYKYVVVDDLGRETRAEFVEAFCDLLDREGHTLLITTNLTRDEMRGRYDLRVLDRLNERALAFDIPGNSMRAQTGGF